MNTPQIIMLILLFLSTGLQFRTIYKDLTISSVVAMILMFITVLCNVLFSGLLHWGGFW